MRLSLKCPILWLLSFLCFMLHSELATAQITSFHKRLFAEELPNTTVPHARQHKRRPANYRCFVEENKRIFYINHDNDELIYWMHGDTLIGKCLAKKLYRIIVPHNSTENKWLFRKWVYVGALLERGLLVYKIPAEQSRPHLFIDFSMEVGDILPISDSFIFQCIALQTDKHDWHTRYASLTCSSRLIGKFERGRDSSFFAIPDVIGWTEGIGYHENLFEDKTGVFWKCEVDRACIAENLPLILKLDCTGMPTFD
ncbi:MAG: hypothetical protein IJ209_00980 [Bacteroidaceae bacterium]|nr:hypothetical protein [Bacteroidaceae bacterium]